MKTIYDADPALSDRCRKQAALLRYRGLDGAISPTALDIGFAELFDAASAVVGAMANANEQRPSLSTLRQMVQEAAGPREPVGSRYPKPLFPNREAVVELAVAAIASLLEAGEKNMASDVTFSGPVPNTGSERRRLSL